MSSKFNLNLDYISYENRIKNILNVNNIELSSKQKVKRINEHLRNEDFFVIYSKKLIEQFKEKNFKNSSRFIRRYKRLFKKLDIELDLNEIDYIEKIRARILAETRNLKRISYPFEKYDSLNNIKRKCYFIFEDVQVTRINGLKTKYLGEHLLLLFDKQIMIYDTELKKPLKEYQYDSIISIETNNVTNLISSKEDKYALVYKDSELINISLKRINKEVLKNGK